MVGKLKILAICGSIRNASSNLNIIKAVSRLASDQFTVNLYRGLSELPHFNPDLDNENVPAAVSDFRKLIRESAGVLICAPEYAMGVPGALKNAIDWTVSSMEFSKKPTVLITASLSGEKAHQSLLGTLEVIEAKMTRDTQLLVPFVKTKITEGGEITDPEMVNSVRKLLASLQEMIGDKEL